MEAMHAINAELIWILICAIAVVCFWRIVLVFFLCVMVGTVLLGLATAVSYLGH
jgi:hypothetical protein